MPAGSSICAIGVLAPKRYSMQGSAKNSTKVLRPAIASKRQHAPPGGDVAGQHQGEEGKGDQEDVKHRRILRATRAGPGYLAFAQ